MYDDLRWMLDSIRHLTKAEDYYGAFVFCLIAVDPLANKRYPKLKSGERFQRFLREERQAFCKGEIYLPDAKNSVQIPTFQPPDFGDFGGDLDKWSNAIDDFSAKLKDECEKLKQSKLMIPIERVLWEYCRCPIVHEGSRLAVDGETKVTLDWSVPAESLKLQVDKDADNVIVIGAPFLLNMLYRIVEKHLGTTESTD